MNKLSRQAGAGLGIGLAVILILGVLKFLQFQAIMAEQAQQGPPPQAVTTFAAQMQVWQERTEVVGELMSRRGAELSTQEQGVVSKVLYTPGKKVSKGEILVALDSRVEQAELQAAKASLKQTELENNRLKNLLARKAVSESSYEKARAEYEADLAQVKSLQARVNRRKVVAPFSGTTGIQKVAQGEFIEPGEPLVSLYDLSELYLNFSVPESQFHQLKVGDQVRFQTESVRGEPFQATVSSLDPQVDQTTRNGLIQATVANPNELLRPGMFARITITSKDQNSYVTIPLSSIQFAPYGNSVFLIQELKNPDGTPYTGVMPSPVTLGPRKGDLVAILTGLEEGTEIVSSGTFKLFPTAPVIINNEVSPGSERAPNPPLT